MKTLAVELLVVDLSAEGGGNSPLRRALNHVGLTSTQFDGRIIASVPEPEQAAVSGSPAILTGGVDRFNRPDS